MSLDRLRLKYQTELNSLLEEEARAINDAHSGKYALPPNHWERIHRCRVKIDSVNAFATALDEIISETKDEEIVE